MARRRKNGDDGAGAVLLLVIVGIVAAVGWLIDFVKANQDAVIFTAFAGVVLVGLVFVARRVERSKLAKAKAANRQQAIELQEARAWQHRETLMLRYDDEGVVAAILNSDIWHDMSKQQLLDSWGKPDDVKTTVMKTKIKEEYRYECVGVNRYRRRVTLENDVVVGWRQ